MTYRLKQMKSDSSVWTITPRPVEMIFYKSFIGDKAPIIYFPRDIRRLINSFLYKNTVGTMITYVDDILVMSSKPIIQKSLYKIKQIWKCSEGECTYKDQVVKFCSLRITRYTDGSLFIDQCNYVKDVIDRNNCRNCNGNKAPLQPNIFVDCPDEDSEDEKLLPDDFANKMMDAQVKAAQTIAGELLYASQKTRIDLAYPVQR